MKEDSFEKKLAAYIAMASAFLAAPKESNGQIIYTDVNPDFYDNNDVHYLDLNNDGIFDYKFSVESNEDLSSTIQTGYQTHSMEVQCLGNSKVIQDSISLPLKLNMNSIISSNQNFGNGNWLLYSHTQWTTNPPYSTSSGNSFGNWNDNQEGYLGLKINVAGINYYGWARLKIINDHLYIYDYAYYNSPNHPIAAGELSCQNFQSDINVTPQNSACEGEQINIQLNQYSGGAITWHDGGSIIQFGVTNIMVNQSGNYFATISMLGCVDTSNTIIATFNPLPQIPVVVQQDSILKIVQLSGATYQWFYGTYPIPNSDSWFIIPQWTGYYHAEVTSDSGCTSVGNDFYFELPTGIENTIVNQIAFFSEQKKLYLFNLPNELLHAEIKIYDMNGRILIEQKLNSSSEQIPLTNFSSGIYFFEISKGEQIVRKKFFVE